MLGAVTEGKGRVKFRRPRTKPVTVWYHKPASYDEGRPVLFLLHGIKRNAKEYLEHWAGETESRGALTLAPEFCSHHYPGARAYNLGEVVSESGEIQPRSDWSYAVLESLFDAVVSDTDCEASSYLAFGHSAGAQFLYRAILLGCLHRVDRAVVANAGWYTLPLFDCSFPYGLIGLEEDCRRQAFRKRLLFLLGEKDTALDDNLRQTSEAMEQGENRLDRGRYVYQAGANAAREIREPFMWSLRSLPEVGHHCQSVIPAAADWLFG